MHLIELSGNAEGRILGENLYDEIGRILLRRGVRLTRSYIVRLQDKGFKSVYVLNELAPDVEIQQAITSETRCMATSAIRTFSERVVGRQAVDTMAIDSAVAKIVEELQGQTDVILNLTSIKSIDNYTFEHCVNVCVLSLVIKEGAAAQGVQYPNELEMGQGAMLHDVGKLVVPREILQKPASLSDEEFEVVRRHTVAGHNMLSEFLPQSLAPEIARSHHERIDGTGYPDGKSGSELSMASRIVAVADVFDAVTSDRAYRRRMKPSVALEVLESVAGFQLDADLVHFLTERVAHYEEGSIVRLNTGELGVVVDQDEHSVRDPAVRRVVDPTGQVMDHPDELLLADEPDVHITECLDDYPESVLDQMD